MSEAAFKRIENLRAHVGRDELVITPEAQRFIDREKVRIGYEEYDEGVERLAVLDLKKVDTLPIIPFIRSLELLAKECAKYLSHKAFKDTFDTNHESRQKWLNAIPDSEGGLAAVEYFRENRLKKNHWTNTASAASLLMRQLTSDRYNIDLMKNPFAARVYDVARRISEFNRQSVERTLIDPEDGSETTEIAILEIAYPGLSSDEKYEIVKKLDELANELLDAVT